MLKFGTEVTFIYYTKELKFDNNIYEFFWVVNFLKSFFFGEKNQFWTNMALSTMFYVKW